jgi:glyceraldehyde 3-phosphate dehydrogenase
MTIRIGINGFGRIGRTVLRAALAQDADVEIVAVNDLAPAATLAALLEWDSLSGHLEGVALDGDTLQVGERRLAVLASPDPAALRWGDHGVDVVIESTGRFTSGDAAAAHLSGGARKVIVSAPASGDVPTVVLGVNDEEIDLSAHDVLSNGSCTTNSLAPLALVLHEAFGIETGLMTTIHAYTADQRLHDAPHTDLRRARAAAVSTIPASSGAADAIGKVLPALKGRLTGAAMRVPVPVGSLTDLTAVLERPASTDEVDAAFREAAASPRLRGILQHSRAPLVSADIVGNPHSSIYDAPLTQMLGRQVKVHGWYDNEWGFANRLVELAQRVGAAG